MKKKIETAPIGPLVYDAELKGFRWINGIGYGAIYGDKKGRFADGEYIRTSRINSKEIYTEGTIYQTQNSRYFVAIGNDH